MSTLLSLYLLTLFILVAVAASFASMQKFSLDLRLMIVKVFFCLEFHMCPLIAFKLDSWTQMLALRFDCCGRKPCYRQKTPLVLGGTRTQDLADSIAIAARALNHCITLTFGIKRNTTEFQVMHYVQALEMLISLIYWNCDFKVVCSRYSAFNYFI